MKKLTLFVLILHLLNSCESNKLIITNTIEGTYYAKGKDYSYEISIKKDGVFSYQNNSLGVVSKCEGGWIIKGNKYILFTCNKSQNPIDLISSGYIGDYSDTIMIFNKNKIKFKHIVLKRK